MAKTAKRQAAGRKTTGAVKRAVRAVKATAAKAVKTVTRRKAPPTALERQAATIGRMAGRAAAMLDKVRAEGSARVARLTSVAKAGAKTPAAKKAKARR